MPPRTRSPEDEAAVKKDQAAPQHCQSTVPDPANRFVRPRDTRPTFPVIPQFPDIPRRTMKKYGHEKQFWVGLRQPVSLSRMYPGSPIYRGFSGSAIFRFAQEEYPESSTPGGVDSDKDGGTPRDWDKPCGVFERSNQRKTQR